MRNALLQPLPGRSWRGKSREDTCTAHITEVSARNQWSCIVLPSEDEFLRSFDRCAAPNEAYRAAGERAKAKNFENCEHKPLITGGKVIDTVSTTPLHISLGIGIHILNVIEKEAISLHWTENVKTIKFNILRLRVLMSVNVKS